MKNKISCIVPAYNEAARIGNVLRVLQKHPLIDEVIVVNDGSEDNTDKIVKKFKSVRLISYKKNRGKTFALLKGIRAAKNNILMFIDSDLIGLQPKNITDLISSVRSSKADVSISIKQNTLAIFKILGLDFVSGERVFHRKILGDISKLRNLTGFGFESFLNQKIIENKLRIKVVNWSNVSHARKSEKIGWIKGTIGELSMLLQIIKTIGISGIFSQNMKMRFLRV
jgi:glycosyltransferase involved in cell wall biosynthesis